MLIPVLLFIVGLLCLIKGGDYFLVTYLMSAGMVQAAIATRYSE